MWKSAIAFFKSAAYDRVISKLIELHRGHLHMLQKLKKDQSGFSIVEVMIVLAIAGLIMLVVFLAVPALQRNSRNTTKKSDVGSIGSVISEFRSANSGKNPTSASTFTAADGVLTLSAGTGTNPISTTLGTSVCSIVWTGTPGTTLDQVAIRTGQKCSSTSSFTITPSGRSVAVLYNLETSGGVANQCLDA